MTGNVTVQSLNFIDVATAYTKGISAENIIDYYTKPAGDTGYTATSVINYRDDLGATIALGVSQSVAAIQLLFDDVTQTELDDVILGIGANADGTYNIPVGSNYLDATVSVMDALDTLDDVLTPCTLVQLRAGTDNDNQVTASTLNQQGLLFDAGYNIGLTKSIVADNITTPNILADRDITGTLDGANATLSAVTISASSNIIVDNTANEVSLYAGDCGFADWQGQMYFTHNGAGAIAMDYWPDAMTFVMDSTPVNAAGGTITMDSWIWGIFLDSSVSGAATLSTIHSDSWNFQSAFTTVQTGNLSAGDWTGFFSDINGINDPLVASYGFRSVTRNVLDASLSAGFYSDIDVETASVNDNSLFYGYFHGSRDAGTNPIDAGLWINFGEAVTPTTFTLDESDASLYGVKVIGNATALVHTDGQIYSFYSYLDAAYTPSATCTRTGLYLGGLYDTGINMAGTFSGNGIDFSGCTYVPTGSAGPCLIRAGSYTTPIANSSALQSGMIRLYMETSGIGASYDRAVFSCLKTTGEKGIITTAGLAEVHTSAGVGPANVKGCEFICDLFDVGSKLPAAAIMHGGWFKVTAIDGATIDATATVAPIWVDNQLYGANASGALEYGIYSTTGGSVPKAWAGFKTTSAGWTNLLYFDSVVAPMGNTAAGNGGFVSNNTGTFTAVGYAKIQIVGNTYYIPYGTIA